MEDKQVSLNEVIKLIQEDVANMRYSFDGKKEWMFAADVVEDLIDIIKNHTW
jgi:hypothetical protein